MDKHDYLLILAIITVLLAFAIVLASGASS